MTAHDHGYKRLFSHPEMIRDLLLGFVREPWIADLDFATLEKYPGEFIDDRLQQRRNDVILATMRNLAAALFRLENSRGPETVREVLAALSAWLARLHAAAGEDEG
ncbi:MAG: Rpn family recombination-promoting nuclease/putative transposase [Candidatus Competibacteraceae bacterium]